MNTIHTRLTIVAFGDSLTVGFQSPTPQNPWYQETPYTQFLGKWLQDKVQILTKGINGELTEEMVRRFEGDVIDHNPDYVIILGGSNDIGWGLPPDEVAQNLSRLFQEALSVHITPVAVTIPSLRGFDDLIPPRQSLNGLIVNQCRSLNIPCVDLFGASAEPNSLRLAQEYSNDGLHLTTRGYKLIADLLYKEVFCNLI